MVRNKVPFDAPGSFYQWVGDLAVSLDIISTKVGVAEERLEISFTLVGSRQSAIAAMRSLSIDTPSGETRWPRKTVFVCDVWDSITG